MTDEIIHILHDAFTKQSYFSRKELEKLLKTYYPHYENQGSLDWRIHDLKKKVSSSI